MSLHSQFLPASHSQLAIWHQSDGSGVLFFCYLIDSLIEDIFKRNPWENACSRYKVGLSHTRGWRGLPVCFNWAETSQFEPAQARHQRTTMVLLAHKCKHTHSSTIYPANVNQRHSSGRASKTLIGFKDHVWKKHCGLKSLSFGCCCTLRRKRQEQESVLLAIYFCNGICYWLQIAWIKLGCEFITLISYLQEWFCAILTIK